MLERNAPSLLWFELSFSLESQEVFFILPSVQDPPMAQAALATVCLSKFVKTYFTWALLEKN